MDILNGAVVEKRSEAACGFLTVAMNTTMLFCGTSFWMFMAVTARDSDPSSMSSFSKRLPAGEVL